MELGKKILNMLWLKRDTFDSLFAFYLFEKYTKNSEVFDISWFVTNGWRHSVRRLNQCGKEVDVE